MCFDSCLSPLPEMSFCEPIGSPSAAELTAHYYFHKHPLEDEVYTELITSGISKVFSPAKKPLIERIKLEAFFLAAGLDYMLELAIIEDYYIKLSSGDYHLESNIVEKGPLLEVELSLIFNPQKRNYDYDARYKKSATPFYYGMLWTIPVRQ